MNSLLKKKYPRELAYAQSSITDIFYNVDNPTKGSKHEDCSDNQPYNIPIDVVAMLNGEYCSYGSSRLYAARNYAPPKYQLTVKTHDFHDTVSEERLDDTGAGNVVFYWPDSVEENSIHMLELDLNSWGLITSLRCACQHSKFSLYGFHVEPSVANYLIRYVPYYKLAKCPNDSSCGVQMLPNESALGSLKAAFMSDTLIVFSPGRFSRIRRRDDFIKLVMDNLAHVSVVSYKRKSGCILKYRSGDDKGDEDFLNDHEMHNMECRRQDERDVRWMEADVEEAEALSKT